MGSERNRRRDRLRARQRDDLRSKLELVGLTDLVALNAATGNALWQTVTGADGYPLNGTVALGGGDVYAGCGLATTGNPGGVCAFKATTGKLLWSYVPDCNCQFNGTLEAPLVYSNGVVFYGVSGFPGQSDPYVVALNAKTGKAIWGYDPGPGAVGSAPLAVSSGNVFFDCVTTRRREGDLRRHSVQRYVLMADGHRR